MTYEPEGHRLILTCLECGGRRPLTLTTIKWEPLAALEATAKHDCPRSASAPAPAPRTPREDREMELFVASRLTRDPAGSVPLRDLLDAWCEQGRSIYEGVFARRLRAQLPLGAEIRREMINGVRARRVVGMRLR